jgi:hypothetical protein
MALATGVEARMIEAEAALKKSDATTYLAKLNDARATVTGLTRSPTRARRPRARTSSSASGPSGSGAPRTGSAICVAS